VSKRKIVIEDESFSISQVKTCYSEDEANDLLSKGWILLHGGICHRDGAGYQAKPVFILGLKKEAT
jgi:hypothetical protein